MAIHVTALNHRLKGRQEQFLDDMHVSERRWFAIHTSSRHEKRAVEDLKKSGIEAYVPLRNKVRHYKTKTVVREIPLLTGYIFVHIKLSEVGTVIRGLYTRGFVRPGKDRRQVTQEEIDLLRALSIDRELDWQEVTDTFDFTEGTLVEIISGTLAGLRGHYVRKKSRKTFIISLLGGGACLASCEIDPTLLAPVGDESRAHRVEDVDKPLR